MDLSKLMEGLKEFFLEILGFLLPGITLIFLLGFFINPDFSRIFDKAWNASHWLLLTFGYIIYGVALLRDNLWRKLLKIVKKKIGVDKIRAGIEKSGEFEISKIILKKLLEDDAEAQNKIDSLSFHSMRGMAMSYIPEADKKIYTFMFRAELCNHLNIVVVSIGMAGLINGIIFHLGLKIDFFYAHFKFIIGYLLLVVTGYFLNLTRNRFLAIAYKIPFPIFIAKFYRLHKPEKPDA